MTADERGALAAFVDAVRAHYGSRLVDILVFGSRARGDAVADSDLDLAIILEDGDWRFWPERMRLSDLMHDALVDHGLYIQAWPISRSDWSTPSKHINPRFVLNAKREALPWTDAA